MQTSINNNNSASNAQQIGQSNKAYKVTATFARIEEAQSFIIAAQNNPETNIAYTMDKVEKPIETYSLKVTYAGPTDNQGSRLKVAGPFGTKTYPYPYDQSSPRHWACVEYLKAHRGEALWYTTEIATAGETTSFSASNQQPELPKFKSILD